MLAQELSGVVAIAQRDVTKLLRDRARLAVNLAFPVLLIGGLGAILQPTVGRVTGVNAVTLAFTGVLAASLRTALEEVTCMRRCRRSKLGRPASSNATISPSSTASRMPKARCSARTSG